jgi:ankyrin repeat protein
MNSSGATPLHDAVSRNCIEIAEELLQGGANPFIQAVKG